MTMTVTELEAMEAALTIKGAIALLITMSVCATILLVLALRRYSRDQEQAHAEAMARIQSSKDMGQTAWAQTDVNKSVIIREQAKRIAELEGWKARTEKRMKDLRLSEVFDNE